MVMGMEGDGDGDRAGRQMGQGWRVTVTGTEVKWDRDGGRGGQGWRMTWLGDGGHRAQGWQAEGDRDTR